MRILLFLVSIAMLAGNEGVASAITQGGVFFDRDGTLTTANPPLFTTDNTFYFVAHSLVDDQIAGYDFGLDVDPTILTFGVPIIGFGQPINTGGGPNCFLADLGGCFAAPSPAVLVEYTYGILTPTQPQDLWICLRPSSFSGFLPPTPGYLKCDQEREPFVSVESACSGVPQGCAIVYPSCVVGSSRDSWGSIKGRFGGKSP